MGSATINDAIPEPDGIAEVHEQRRAALGEFIQARNVYHRQELARMESYADLTKFLSQHRKELPPFVQEFLDAWQDDHKSIEVAYSSSATALRATQNAIYASQNEASGIFNRYANRIDEVRKKMHEPNQDHVFENSKLADLLAALTQFAERKRKRKGAK